MCLHFYVAHPRCAATAALVAGVGAVYLHGLGDVGLLGPDEPRYAAIGRAMASSGDWVTPRLWGEAWFEKPPLLYWLTALGQAPVSATTYRLACRCLCSAWDICSCNF